VRSWALRYTTSPPLGDRTRLRWFTTRTQTRASRRAGFPASSTGLAKTLANTGDCGGTTAQGVAELVQRGGNAIDDRYIQSSERDSKGCRNRSCHSGCQALTRLQVGFTHVSRRLAVVLRQPIDLPRTDPTCESRKLEAQATNADQAVADCSLLKSIKLHLFPPLPPIILARISADTR